MFNRRMALVALSVGLGVGLTACGSSGPQGAGPAGQVHLAGKLGQWGAELVQATSGGQFD